MSLFTFTAALLAAATAITSVQASPFSGFDTRSFNGLVARDFSTEECKDFVYGSNNVYVGKICYSLNGKTLTITYPPLGTSGAYEDLHVIVQSSSILSEQLPVGHWPYTKGNGHCDISTGKCVIPIQSDWKCGKPLYIGCHASYTPDGLAHETGWMNGPCIEIKGKGNGNCPKSTSFTPQCECPVVTKYEPVVASVYISSHMQKVTANMLKQVVYKKTVIETFTDYCTSFPADVATKTSCDTPYAATTETIHATADAAAYTCPTPA
jgi:hypothetical protein